ncbi:lysoplasmalogenase [Cellulomonas sp. URHB0016]
MVRSLSTAARAWVGVFVAVSAVLLVSLLVGADALGQVTQWLAMPALAGVLLSAARWPRGRLVTLTAVALGLSWLGDLLPSFAGEQAFLVMVGCFLAAQIVYVVAFSPFVRRSVLHRRPVVLVAYGTVLVGLVGACAPHAGDLLLPVAVYGGCLISMAVLATGLGRAAGTGAAVFVVSDALIALEQLVPAWHLPGQDFWVMLTYLAGQALLTFAVLQHNLAERKAPPVPVRLALTQAVKRDNVIALV